MMQIEYVNDDTDDIGIEGLIKIGVDVGKLKYIIIYNEKIKNIHILIRRVVNGIYWKMVIN